MIYEITIILKAHIVVLFIIIVSYIIESISEFKLLIWGFKHKKNLNLAEGAANVNAILYFIICLLTLLYDRFYLKNNAVDFSFLTWLLIMIPFVVIFRHLYLKFQHIDPERGDHDISD